MGELDLPPAEEKMADEDTHPPSMGVAGLPTATPSRRSRRLELKREGSQYQAGKVTALVAKCKTDLAEFDPGFSDRERVYLSEREDDDTYLQDLLTWFCNVTWFY